MNPLKSQAKKCVAGAKKSAVDKCMRRLYPDSNANAQIAASFLFDF
jgi:hypothetical protein